MPADILNELSKHQLPMRLIVKLPPLLSPAKLSYFLCEPRKGQI